MSRLRNLFKKKQKEVKNDYKDLLEKLAEDGKQDLIWMLLGSLISADTLTSKEACENSIMMLTELRDAVERVGENVYTAEEKEKIKQQCTNGIEICKQDLEIFTADEDSIQSEQNNTD